MVSQAARISDEMAQRLERMASTTRRSKTSPIVETLERYLKEYEDLELALSRFRDPDAEWIDKNPQR